MSRAVRVPRLAAAILRMALPTVLRDDVLGDLQEGHAERCRREGRWQARRWYWHQTFRALGWARAHPSLHTAPWRDRLMGSLGQDLAYAFRQLGKQPGFTAAAIASLALGIGINTAVFSVVNGALLRPLPVEDPGEVVEIYTGQPEDPHAHTSLPDYLDYRDRNTVFEGLAAHMTYVFNWNRETRSELIFGEIVSGNYFDVVGVEAAVGRTFRPEEDGAPGERPVVVLGHGFWERNFGADPEAVGSTIRLNGNLFTIIGVAPERFTSTFPVFAADVWIPLSMQPAVAFAGFGGGMHDRRGFRSLVMMGRLADGSSLEEARAQLASIAAALAEAYPGTNEGRQVALVPLQEVRFHPEIDAAVTPAAALMMSLVGLVLLIACANIANMLLARAASRRREIAVRLALGAGRWRLVRQLLTESVILGLGGGLIGLLLASWATGLLLSVQPPFPVSIALDLGIDHRVLGFALLASVATAMAFGLAPALQSSRPDLVGALKDDAQRGVGAGRRLHLRDVLVVAQVAVSTVLLVAAGLFLRSLGNASTVDLGFEEEGLAYATTNLGMMGYETGRSRQYVLEVVERVKALPDVEAVAYTERMPLSFTSITYGFGIEDHDPPGDEEDVSVQVMSMGPGFLSTMGIPLVAGREFRETDIEGSPGVAVVNEAFVRRYWPDGRALGRGLRLEAGVTPESEGRRLEVVGVAADYKLQTLGEEPTPVVHLPFQQSPATFLQTVLARTDGDPAALVARIREEMLAVDDSTLIFDGKPMRENLGVALFPVRLAAALLGVCGGLALLLAAVGVYGVIAYTVSRRTHEIGVRMALGADRDSVLWLVVRQGMGVVVVGVVLGAVLALGVGRLAGSLLYGVSPADPVSFGVTLAVLLAVALVANWVPARRGAAVDPVTALRRE